METKEEPQVEAVMAKRPVTDLTGMTLDDVLTRVGTDLERVESQFERNLESEVPLIPTVGRYVLMSGGKRIRPLLLLLSARLCGYRGPRAIPLASIVEFIHTATLLHDDVVDNAELRRGERSANAVWGNEASVLVGDFLFSKSFSLMVGDGDVRVFKAVSDATTAMAEGEVLELLKVCDLEVTVDEYLRVIENKTAVLIAAACEIGALLGSPNDERVATLRGYGMDVGVAFQLIDDCLDYVGDRKRFGKPVGADLEEGKITLPMIHALSRGTDDDRARVEALVEQDTFSDIDREWARGFVERTGGLAVTRTMALDRIARARSRLTFFPDTDDRRALEVVAEYVVSRSR